MINTILVVQYYLFFICLCLLSIYLRLLFVFTLFSTYPDTYIYKYLNQNQNPHQILSFLSATPHYVAFFCKEVE